MHCIIPSMGRPRSRHFDLPPRMQAKGNALYYVGPDRKWRRLGSDLARAKRLWADLEFANCHGRTVADLATRWYEDGTSDLSANTRRQYKSAVNRIVKEWGNLPCQALVPPQLATWRDSGVGLMTANIVLSVLRKAYAKAVEWGWCPLNPAKAVAFNKKLIRERYLTDAEFRAIYAAAPSWLQTYMDIGYATSLRVNDVLSLRWSQVSETAVTVLPQKTSKTRVSLSYEINAELRLALETARRRPICGLYVVATDKGRRITMTRLQDTWREIVNGLGIEDCTPRDIRSKSGTDANAQGEDAQELLNHSSEKMTRTYLKLGQTKRVRTFGRKV